MFMKEIQELAKGFTETTEKTMALEKLWEESSKFSGKLDFFLIMNCFVYNDTHQTKEYFYFK